MTTSTPVASVVTTMKIEQLDEVARWSACRGASSQRSPPPRGPSGPTSRTPRSGTSVGGHAERRGRAATCSEVGLLGGCRRSRRRRGSRVRAPTRLVPLPVGSSTPSSKSGWWRTGLACDPRRVGQVQAVRAAVVAEPRDVVGGVAARLVGQRLEHDVQREAAERLGLQLAGVDDAARAGRGTPGRTSRAPAAGPGRRPRRAGSGCRRSRRGSPWRCRRTPVTSLKSALQLAPRGPRACRWS